MIYILMRLTEYTQDKIMSKVFLCYNGLGMECISRTTGAIGVMSPRRPAHNIQHIVYDTFQFQFTGTPDLLEICRSSGDALY